MRIELNSERLPPCLTSQRQIRRTQCGRRASYKLRSSLDAEEKCVFVSQPVTFSKGVPAESLCTESLAIRDLSLTTR
jgi:hypothetical protein